MYISTGVCHGLPLVGRQGVEPGLSVFHMMRRDTANQLLIWWAMARPGLPIFQRMDRGPDQPITFSNSSARPGLYFSSFSNRPDPVNDMVREVH